MISNPGVLFPIPCADVDSAEHGDGQLTVCARRRGPEFPQTTGLMNKCGPFSVDSLPVNRLLCRSI